MSMFVDTACLVSNFHVILVFSAYKYLLCEIEIWSSWCTDSGFRGFYEQEIITRLSLPEKYSVFWCWLSTIKPRISHVDHSHQQRWDTYLLKNCKILTWYLLKSMQNTCLNTWFQSSWILFSGFHDLLQCLRIRKGRYKSMFKVLCYILFNLFPSTPMSNGEKRIDLCSG